METRSGIEHFWSPPEGETLLGMARYQDMIVVAASDGVYVISPPGTGGLMNHHEVRKIAGDLPLERQFSPFMQRHPGPEEIDRERATECWNDIQQIPSSIGGAIEVLATWFRKIRDEAKAH